MRRINLFKNFNLRDKLLIAFLIILIPVSITGSAITYFTLRHCAETCIETQLDNTTSSIQNMVRASAMVGIKNHLQSIVGLNIKIIDHFWHKQADKKLRKQESINKIREVLLMQTIGQTGYLAGMDSSGTIIIHPDKSLEGQNLLSYEFVKKMLNKKQGYLEYLWKGHGDKKEKAKVMSIGWFKPLDLILFATAYKDEFSELVDINDFRESIREFSIAKTGYSFLIDIDKQTIVHPVLSVKYLKDAPVESRRFFDKLIKNKVGQFIYSWKNPDDNYERKKLVLFNYLPEYNWVVASTSYLDEIYQPLDIIKKTIVIVLLVTILLNIIIIIRISSSVTKPVEKMKEKFAIGAKGDFTVRMQCFSNDEIGQLSEYFNLFMENLENFSKRIKAEISEREKVENKLIESKNRLELAIEVSKAMIWELNTATNEFYMDEKSLSLLGYSQKDFKDKSRDIRSVMLHPDEIQDINKGLDDHISGKTRLFKKEYRMRTKEGNWLWFHARARLVYFNGENQPGVILGVMVDITDRKLSETALKESEKLFYDVVNHSPVGLSLLQKNRIVFMNPAQKKIFGNIPESYEFSSLNVIAEDQLKFKQYCKLLNEYKAISAELEIRFYPYGETPKTHRRSYASIRTSQIEFKGEKAMLINMANITQARELEALVHIREKMVSLGHVAAGIAHEIRNPLSGIMLLLGGIDEAFIEPEKHGEVKELITLAKKASDKIALVVKRVLDFSKPSQLFFEMGDINKAVSEALLFTETALRKSGILIRTTLDNKLPEVYYDTQCMTQVIINLITNSIEAMKNCSGIKYINILTESKKNEVIIRIADTGPGIPGDVLAKIFDPFFTTRNDGSGIGLSLCQRIIADHGGTINALPLDLCGSEFIIRLPVRALEKINLQPN